MTNQTRGGRGAGRPSDRPTKTDKKEDARLEREAIRRRMAARRRNRTIAMVAGVVIALGVVVSIAMAGGSPKANQGDGQALPGLLTTSAPWDANNAQVQQRMAQITLPPFMDQPGVGEHHHIRLWLYVDGAYQTVPQDIAVVNQIPLSPLHTHDTTGTVHVETSDPTYTGTLGQFFDVWGVRLSATCLGGYCNSGDRTLTAYVNGKPYQGDPRQIPMTDQSAVVLMYGTKDQVPNPMPDTFTFTGG